MPKTREETLEYNRSYYQRWRAANPDYYKNRRAALGDTLREAERNRDKKRRNNPNRKATNASYRQGDSFKAVRKVHRQTRRARLRDAFVEKVIPREVFERDLYVCQRCWKQCPSKSTVPDPDSPTVDHIVALSNGGEHSYANTQCMCFVCNSTKGAS
ncbi:HNH endonuclease [Mycobacteroides abscessus]|uniref:HNH endonuclease n=1 Tax=Mycobacteroides abscessus TaxID=36809 RepID=UPI000D3EDD84|nr:hypothetical protein DDJ46_17690 [Mycobacteroides abscessus]